MLNLRNRKSKITRRIEAPLSANFSPNEIASLAGLGTLVEVPTGEILLVEGTTGSNALLLVEGNASVHRDAEVVATLSSCDLVGERAVLTGQRRNATVVATSPVTALSFERQEFAWLRLESDKVGSLSRELVASRA